MNPVRFFAIIAALISALALSISAHAGGTVGSGTPASCTETAFDNALTGGGTVTFNCGGAKTITLTSPKMIADNTTIDGGGLITLSGGNTTYLFGVLATKELTLQNITLENGSANNGGAVSNAGTTTIINSQLIANSSLQDAGAIYNNGTLNVINSSISNNTAGGAGGGIYSISGVVTLINSTISNNSAKQFGGGIVIFINGGTLNAYYVTIAGNLANSYVTGTSTGGGIKNVSGTVNMKGVLLGQNYAGPDSDDCNGALNSLDYNLIQTIAGCTISGNTMHNITGVDPKIDSARNNGGPTPTRALLAGSPAIDAIPIAECKDQAGAMLTVDQRGFPRPVGGACDIGAFEGAQPTPQYNRNLIRNGDAESGAGSPTGAFVGTPNWIVTAGRGFTAVPYNAAGGFPTTDMAPANHGYNFFAGGNLYSPSTADQLFNVSTISADIDAGRVKYALSADLGGFQDQDDSALLLAAFYDGAFMLIGNPVQIGPVTAADRGNVTGFRNRSENGVVPSGTRTIRVQVEMIMVTGPYNDGYADNLSLVLTTNKLYLPLIMR